MKRKKQPPYKIYIDEGLRIGEIEHVESIEAAINPSEPELNIELNKIFDNVRLTKKTKRIINLSFF